MIPRSVVTRAAIERLGALSADRLDRSNRFGCTHEVAVFHGKDEQPNRFQIEPHIKP